MQCAAITLTGARCTRRAQVNSIYCWQHQHYSNVANSTVPVSGVILKSKKTSTSAKAAFITPAVMKEQKEKINKTPEMFQFPDDVYFRIDDVNLDNLDLDTQQIDSLKNLGAIGPVILVCPVGAYDDTFINIELEFKSGEYTFQQIITHIYQLYTAKTTNSEIDDLIKVAKSNKDQLSEGLYTQKRIRIKRGESIPLYELNEKRLHITGIALDKSKKYYLQLLDVQ
jgi:hypothetical protein